MHTMQIRIDHLIAQGFAYLAGEVTRMQFTSPIDDLKAIGQQHTARDNAAGIDDVIAANVVVVHPVFQLLEAAKIYGLK